MHAWYLKIKEAGSLGNHGAATIQQPLLTGTVTSYLPTAILTSGDKPVLSGIGRVGLRYSQRFTNNIIKWSTVMERGVK